MKERINNNIMDKLSPELYLQIVGSILLCTGFGLFLYCMLFRLNIAYVETLSNPLFYLVLGVCCIVFSFFVKKHGFDLEVDNS